MSDRVKLARCPKCGAIIIASSLPLGDEDADTLREFRKASQDGLRIEYMSTAEYKSGDLSFMCKCGDGQLSLPVEAAP